jgi:cytochrome P450
MELFDPHSNEWLNNKFLIYSDLRKRDTAYWSEKYNMHIITRYNDVLFALSNPDIFSSAKGNLIIEDPGRFNRTLGASDKPKHDFLKNIVKNAYSKENIDRISSCFSHHAHRLLSNKDSLNLSDSIIELSAWCIAEIINFPWDKQEIVNLIIDIQNKSSLSNMYNIDNTSFEKFTSIFNQLWKNRTEPTGEGIYKEFYHNDTMDHPNPHPRFSLFIGPIISGASSLAGGVLFLTLDLYRNEVIEKVINDKSLIKLAVNESLRYHASTGRFSRTVVKDIELHGVKFSNGDRVALCMDSANRDGDAFENPDHFDLHRKYKKGITSLAFGYGPHACIAQAIARNVMEVWLEILCNKLGKYKITTDHEFKYHMTASGNNDFITNLIIEKTK